MYIILYKVYNVSAPPGKPLKPDVKPTSSNGEKTVQVSEAKTNSNDSSTHYPFPNFTQQPPPTTFPPTYSTPVPAHPPPTQFPPPNFPPPAYGSTPAGPPPTQYYPSASSTRPPYYPPASGQP